jgi:hypothetical protein
VSLVFLNRRGPRSALRSRRRQEAGAGHTRAIRLLTSAATFLASALLVTAQTNFPLNTNALAPHQFITTNSPPQSPATFTPDFGVPPSRYNPNPPAQPAVGTRWITNTPPEPAAPGMFNPDPGAMLKSQPVNAPFFTNSFAAPPVYRGEAIPAGLTLPRTNVRSERLEITNAPGGHYGLEPLPPGLELPRTNTRGNLYIKEKWENPKYKIGGEDYSIPTFAEPETNRWRIGFMPWRRYTSGDIEQPYESPKPMLWRPYAQSILKGDAPIWGQDIFLDLTAGSETIFELRRVPTPSGVSASHPNSAEFYGKSEQMFVQNNFSFTIDLFKGETVFQPVHWALRLEPVFNVNYIDTRENNVIKPNPQRGTDRFDQFVALQQAFIELHIRDLSENYDFIASRFGNQAFNSDFRGFIFNDVNLAARLFGNYDNNRWQYNVVAFDMDEKDTNSELNKFARRGQDVFIANVYRQDFIWHGYTAQLSFHANLDHGGTHYDENGNLTRPEPLGTLVPHDVDAFYFGWAGDGHIGRLNLSHAFYEVVGRDSFNGLAGRQVDINAQMAALEVSYDRDWIRYKASMFYASGDDKATDGTAHGFDSIVDNPNFTGGPFSWYVHQGFNLGGTAVGLKQRDSLIPDLRSSKSEGQANFVNPGVLLLGIGTEMDLTPKLRSFINANYIRFMETDPLKAALLTDRVAHELGYDLSLGFQYRPLLTDNIIISTGFGTLIPGAGYRDIYKTSTSPVAGYGSHGRGSVDDFLYSAVLSVTFTY